MNAFISLPQVGVLIWYGLQGWLVVRAKGHGQPVVQQDSSLSDKLVPMGAEIGERGISRGAKAQSAAQLKQRKSSSAASSAAQISGDHVPRTPRAGGSSYLSVDAHEP